MPKIMSGKKKRKLFRIELANAQRALSNSTKQTKKHKPSEEEISNLIVYSSKAA